MRLTEFWERMRAQFGEAYAESVAKDQVLAALGDRTVNQALADGENVKTVWRAVAETFRTVLTAKRGTAALAELKQQLQALASGESVPRLTALDAVEALLRKAQAGSEDEADRSARAYAEFVTKQYDAAVVHSRKKP